MSRGGQLGAGLRDPHPLLPWDVRKCIHANANFATAITGSAITGSYAKLAVSTVNTTNTLNLRIIGFEDTPANNDAAVAGRLAIVLLNNHFYRYNANGTGAGI